MKEHGGNRITETVSALKGKKNRHGKSFTKVTLKIVIPVFLLLLVISAVMFMGIMQTRELAYQYIEDTAGLYVEQINRDILQINADLIMTLRGSREMPELPDEMMPSQGQYYGLLNEIMEQNRVLKIRYREADYIYVYKEAADLLILNTGVYFGCSQKQGMVEEMVKCLKEKEGVSTNSVNWTILKDSSEYYIFSWYFHKGMAMGCVMRVSNILSDLKKIDLGYDVFPYMERFDGEILLAADSEEMQNLNLMREKAESQKRWNGYRQCAFRLTGLGRVQMLISPSGGLLERTLQVQLLLMALAAGVTLIGLVSACIYYVNILKPMKKFVDGLKNMKEEQMLNQDESNHILELEMASREFRELLRKIKMLKITIYENELERQRAELEYTQEQIKPHFFLNCLSIIHGIAEKDGEYKIVHITETLSSYLRYIFKDTRQQRRLKEEIDHVLDYVEIQKVRYGEAAFSFEIIRDGDSPVDDIPVPSLLLQTLVENAVTHGVTLDTHVEITLYLVVEHYDDGPYLYMTLADTGKGFRDDILEALEKDTPIYYNGRKHVGLQNIRRRLKLLYGGRGSVSFSNMDPGYGAVVEVRLPAILPPHRPQAVRR